MFTAPYDMGENMNPREQINLTKPVCVPFLIATWILSILISILPDVLFVELTGHIPAWLFWAKIGLLSLLLFLGLFWEIIRPLWQYFIVFLVLYLSQWAFGWIGNTPQWRSWFGSSVFTTSMLGNQLLKLGPALILVIAMWIMKRRWNDMYLTIGKLDASAGPVSWLGIDNKVSWKNLGWISALCISGGTLAFLVIAGHPSLSAFTQLPPLLPAILIFAVTNAFSEEMSFRAPQLATLQEAIGPFQAILLTATYFGIAHYYGVPYGMIGVVMSGVLGWFLGKSMYETKGFFWPWFIHFMQDVMIFSFMALGAIAAGGR